MLGNFVFDFQNASNNWKFEAGIYLFTRLLVSVKYTNPVLFRHPRRFSVFSYWIFPTIMEFFIQYELPLSAGLIIINSAVWRRHWAAELHYVSFCLEISNRPAYKDPDLLCLFRNNDLAYVEGNLWLSLAYTSVPPYPKETDFKEGINLIRTKKLNLIMLKAPSAKGRVYPRLSERVRPKLCNGVKGNAFCCPFRLNCSFHWRGCLSWNKIVVFSKMDDDMEIWSSFLASNSLETFV